MMQRHHDATSALSQASARQQLQPGHTCCDAVDDADTTDALTAVADINRVSIHLAELAMSTNNEFTAQVFNILFSDGCVAPFVYPKPDIPVTDLEKLDYKENLKNHNDERRVRLVQLAALARQIFASLSLALQELYVSMNQDRALNSSDPHLLITNLRKLFIGQNLTVTEASINLERSLENFCTDLYDGQKNTSSILQKYKATIGEAVDILRSIQPDFAGVPLTRSFHCILQSLNTGLGYDVLRNFKTEINNLTADHAAHNQDIVVLRGRSNAKQAEIVQVAASRGTAAAKKLSTDKLTLEKSVIDLEIEGMKPLLSKMPASIEELLALMERRITTSGHRNLASRDPRQGEVSYIAAEQLDDSDTDDADSGTALFASSESSSSCSNSSAQKYCNVHNTNTHNTEDCYSGLFCTHCSIPGHNIQMCKLIGQPAKKFGKRTTRPAHTEHTSAQVQTSKKAKVEETAKKPPMKVEMGNKHQNRRARHEG